MSGGGDRSGPKGFEIPDLDLPPPNPRASQSSLKAVAPSDSGRSPVSGSVRAGSSVVGDPSGTANLAGAELDLELEGPISRAPIPGRVERELPLTDDGFELDSVRAPPLQGLVVAPEGRANWPSGETPSREQLMLDPVEIRVLADYGAPPTFGPLQALYAIRVTRRKQALKMQLRRVERELAAVETARDARLAALAERLLPELSQSEAFRRVLSPLSELDTLANERGRALSTANAEQSAELGRLDAELAAIQGELAAERAAKTELAQALEAREIAFHRVEARQKRCFIEIRGIEQQAAQRLGPEGGEMPPDLFALLKPLKAQAEALRPELEQSRAAFDASRAEDETRARKVRELEKRASEVERKKSQLGERFRRQLDVRQEGVGEAKAQRQKLLADVGRAVLASRGGVSVDEPTLENLRQAETSVLELVKKSELCVHALDACDNAKVKSGFAWILGACALIAAYLAYRNLSA